MVSLTTNSLATTHISPTTSVGNSVADRSSQTDLKATALQDSGKVPNKTNDIENLTKKLNQVAQDENLSVSFGYDKELNKVYINVIDKESGKVIRKLPSEEAMRFAKSIKEAVGKLLDKRG